ncbi:MAG: tetratricopeptide repeat protein [Bryobacterales bacterium]|nr:tetratricopeptide repeat protein [Bryobacterales bacterium]MBV9401838.1 tetratricopeptide repeat protein [Bryobacterales bacterium]
MARKRAICVCVAVGAVCLIRPVLGDTYQLILRGKVVMQDGSAPPKSVGIERVCSDTYGSAPGPITDKKGEYLWRMEVDPMRTRTCRVRATLVGYSSTEIDISALNSYSNPDLPPLVLTARGADPNSISVLESEVPGKAQPEWKTAMKALDSSNFPEATRHMEAAVKAVPKFPQGWNALGIIYEKQDRRADAKEAYQHAIDQDPKMLPAYLNLARLSIKAKDWDAANKAADTLIKADKRLFPEIYLHAAVAKYQLKDLAGAEASAQEAIRADGLHRMPRSEYVLGRILEAKGDTTGAREHISKYLEMAPNAPDAAQIKASLETLGKADAGAQPELEVL